MTALQERIGVGGALVVGFALRLHTLAAANAWWDEALAVWAVRKGVAGVTAWTAGDVHPPMYFWQLAAWVALVGEAEFPSRALTAVTGVALIAVTYALGRRAGGVAGGIAAAWLAALAPLLVWWSMELRMYTTAGLFLAAALAPALRWQAGASGTRALVGYAVCTWAALHTVYLSAAGVGLVAVAILVAVWRDRQRRKAWVWAQAAVVLASIPWFTYALPRMSSWSSITEPATLAFTVQLWLTLLATGRSATIEGALVATLVFWTASLSAAIAATALGPWRPRGRGSANARVAAACMSLFLVVPPVVVWMATQPRSVFYSPGLEARYFVPFAAPALALAAAAAGAAWRTWRPLGAAGALAVLLVATISLPAYYAGRRWHDGVAAMTGAIWSQARAGDGVLLVSGNRYPIFRHVYDRRAPPGGQGDPYGHTFARPPSPSALAAPADRPPVYEIPEAGGGVLAEYEWERELDRLMERHPRLWLVELESHLQDPEGDVEKWLAARRTRVLSEGYGPDALHLFAEDGRPPDAAGADSYLEERLPEAGGAVWTGPVASAAQPGDQVNLAVAAHSAPDPVRLTTRDGVEVLRADWTAAGARGSVVPTGPRVRYRAALDISARIPDGDYSIVSDVTCRPAQEGGIAPETRSRQATQLASSAAAERGQDGGAGDIVARGHATAAECLHLRVRGSAPATHLAPAAAHFGSEADALPVLAGIGRASPAAGQVMVVDLLWDAVAVPERAGDSVAEPVAVAAPESAGDSVAEPVAFAHLLGPVRADGSTVWAGEDHALVEPGAAAGGPAQRMTRLLLPVPPDLPAGRYELEIGVYDRVTGERYGVSGSGAGHAVDDAGRRIVISNIDVP